MTWDELEQVLADKEKPAAKDSEDDEKTDEYFRQAAEFLGLTTEKEEKSTTKEEEEEEEVDSEDVLWEALLLLKASADTLRGFAYLDRTGNFLTPEACVDLDMLMHRIEKLTEQYELSADTFDGMYDVVANCEKYMLESR